MNFNTLDEQELVSVAGGDAFRFVYDVARAIRFIGLSGGGPFLGNAVADWMGTSAINGAQN